MKNKEMKAIAKDNLKGRFGTALLGSVLCSVVEWVASAIPVIGSLLVIGPMEVGVERMYYKTSNKETPSIKDLFSQFDENFGETFLLGILKGLFIFLWSLLLVIPGIVKSYSYSMSYYLMNRDSNLSATEAIDKSRELMNGEKGRLFLLNLSFIGWSLLCVLTFGIAAIYVAPYMKETKTVFFNEIYDRKA